MRIQDDVRSSLDLLDSVIGEFDDGFLTSGTEDGGPEAPIQKHVIKRPPFNRGGTPPKRDPRLAKRRDKSAPPRTLNDKIDDIFSELTNEINIESEQKRGKISEKRRVNDPLPTPPVPPPAPPPMPKVKDKVGEVIVHESNIDNNKNKEIIPLAKSVKAQIHSLEARGRLETKAKLPINVRSRSENPPKFRGRAPPDEDHPPPMPEKTKIHLKSRSNTSSFEKASVTRSNARKMASPVGQNVSQKLIRSPDSSVSQRSRGSSSNQYEIVSTSQTSSSKLSDRESRPRSQKSGADSKSQYKRSRSMGAVEARMIMERNMNKESLVFRRPDSSPTEEFGKSHRGDQRGSKERSKNRVRKFEDRNSNHGRSLEKRNSSLQKSNPNLTKEFPESNFSSRFAPTGKMPTRQKSMIDLRDPGFELHHPPPLHNQHLAHLALANQPKMPRHRGALLQRSATEHEIKRHGKQQQQQPQQQHLDLDHLPPLLRRQMMVQQAASHAAQAAQAGPLNRHSIAIGPSTVSNNQSSGNDPFLMRQLTLEAQREFLMRKGFSSNHPFITGEIDIHPELQGRLPFHPSGHMRTIPLRPEDYQRFRPELWLQPKHNHNPVAFNDLAVLHNELLLRKERELHRQNSQRMGEGTSEDNSFQSLPWEDIILGKETVPANQEHYRVSQEHRVNKERKKKKNNGWFGMKKANSKETKLDHLGDHEHVRQNGDGHWFLKEKSLSQDHKSLPPIGTLPDSGISEEIGSHLQDISRSGTGRSSFGIILKDKFQKNPNVYFPSEQNRERHDDLSDSDTLIQNMSDGSYEKEELNLSGADNSVGTSSLSPHNSMEGSPRMIYKDSDEAVNSHHPGVSLVKKTLRNYTPKESSNMLRELDERRKSRNSKPVRKESGSAKSEVDSKSSVDKMIEDFHRNLPPPNSEKVIRTLDEEDLIHGTAPPSTVTTVSKRPSKHGTITSQVSNWSAASSTASFDYQPAGLNSNTNKSKSSKSSKFNHLSSVNEDTFPNASPQGERIPPEGAASESSPHTFVQRIEVKAEINSPPKSLNKQQQSKSGSKGVKSDPVSARKPEGTPAATSETDDEFSNLRKLISEGRIAGLNEKPPSFIPPTPPSTSKALPSGKSAASTSVNANKRNHSKAPAPKPNKSPNNLEKQPSRKSREAPKPPVKQQQHHNKGTNDRQDQEVVKESVEDLTHMERRRAINREHSNAVRRSPSHHENRSRYEKSREESRQMAQLIADSTEKKFNFNPFKGMWKKKHYSFDFN